MQVFGIISGGFGSEWVRTLADPQGKELSGSLGSHIKHKRGWRRLASAMIAVCVMGVLSGTGEPHAGAQASAIPSAQAAPDDGSGSKGRKLLDQMVDALGGDKWRSVVDWTEYGQGSTFYKGAANPFVFVFEEYYRAQPFGERVVIVSKNANPLTELLGVPMSKAKRDVATVWTPESGYEVTFQGKKELPKDDIADYQRRRKHTLQVMVNDWLKRPGTLVTFEGTDMYSRRIADKVSVLTADNDSITVMLDSNTHLPVSRIFQWRNPTYKDFDTDEEQYDNYQPQEDVMTPLTVTRLHNGDMVSQRYLKKVVYNSKLSVELFDPDRPLQKKAK